MLKNFPLYFKTFFSNETISVKIRIFFRILAISLAVLHTWAAINSQSMNADGISYLDIGDAYFRADWENAINPVWPPLYAWILGLVNFIFKPAMAWEFPTVHILNFAIFIVTMVSFEFLWRSLGKYKSENTLDMHISLPNWVWWSLGYVLFIWTSLILIQIWAVTPDMLMAALVFLATGILIDIRNGSQEWHNFIFLGLILGLAYLAKTFMFSISLVFLTICLVLVQRSWMSLAKILLSAGIFLLVSLPFIFLISTKKGKITIGEAGAVTYMRYVYGIPFPHWQGDASNDLILTHPSRLIHQSPPVYEFSEPIGGTYPISTDPSYWYEGLEMKFKLGSQLARLFSSGLVYIDLFFQKQGVLLAGVIALYGMGQRRKSDFHGVFRRWALVIPPVIAFGLYGLVLVADRYIGIFVFLFWADILANIQLPDTTSNKSWLNIVSSIAFLGIMVNIILFNFDGFTRLNPTLQTDVSGQTILQPAKPLIVAQALLDLGVDKGDKVGIIGYGFDSFWARLARVKIVAEMLDTQADEFWSGNDDLRQNVLLAFASVRVKAVVAEDVPGYARLDGWHQIGKSNYFIYVFEE